MLQIIKINRITDKGIVYDLDKKEHFISYKYLDKFNFKNDEFNINDELKINYYENTTKIKFIKPYNTSKRGKCHKELKFTTINYPDKYLVNKILGHKGQHLKELIGDTKVRVNLKEHDNILNIQLDGLNEEDIMNIEGKLHDIIEDDFNEEVINLENDNKNSKYIFSKIIKNIKKLKEGKDIKISVFEKENIPKLLIHSENKEDRTKTLNDIMDLLYKSNVIKLDEECDKRRLKYIFNKVIGKGGETIKSISKKYNANIQVFEKDNIPYASINTKNDNFDDIQTEILDIIYEH